MILYVYRAIILLIFFFPVAWVVAAWWYLIRTDNVDTWDYDDLFEDACEVLIDGEESKYLKLR